MKRKILSLILVFAMTVSLFTVGTGAVEPTYGDTAGHWAESSIERWSAYGIIQGSNGLFDPNGQLTCAQLATILAKLLKLPAAKDAGFTDNTADAWYYDAINRCAAAGILNGNGDGTVTPEAPITRERAMVMLARALGIEPIRKPDLTKYTDAAQVSAYAQGYVAALIEAGIVGGVTADELAPQDNINRASTVTILDRAISTYADKAGATVKADGKGLVLVVAENVKITGAPEGTKIVVADGATGLTVNGKSVSDDQTYIVPKTEPAKPSSSSSGGSVHTHDYTIFVTDWSTMTTVKKCSCGATQTIENSNTYYIANDTDLKAFRNKVNAGEAFEGKTIELTKDISLAEEWAPIGNGSRNGSTYTDKAFKGIFDGKGKSISNVKITANTTDANDAIGLFGVVDGGTVKNVTLNVNINVANNELAGGAIGLLVNDGTAEKIHVTGNVKAADGVGGIVGRMLISGTIKECLNEAVVNAAKDGSGSGGIVGKAYYTATGKTMNIQDCENRGSITAAYCAGGIAGLSAADVSGCTNSGSVTAGNHAGGIVGEQTNYGAVSGNTNSAAVIGKTTAAGGIIGWVRYQTNESAYPNTALITVTGNTNSGSIGKGEDGTGELGYGGIVGTLYNQGTVSGNTNNAPTITGGTFAAGIVGGPQIVNDNKKINETTVTITNNVTTTTLDKISGTNTDLIAWKNDESFVIDNNSGTGWTAKIGEVQYATLGAALAAAENGDTVKLVKDITTNTTIEVTGNKTITIDFDAYTLTGESGVQVLRVGGTANVTLTATTGGINGGSRGNNVAIIAKENATINITSGNYTVGGDANGSGNSTVYVVGNGKVNISGGTFSSEKTYRDKYYVLNLKNDATGSISVTGGTFVGQNPGVGDDNKGGTFLAEGCITLVNGGTFTVSDTNEIPVTTATVQDYLDGKYGSINGKTLVLAEGDYGRIEFGRATAYAGSNTKYYLGGIESSPDAIKQNIADHPNGGAGKREYVRSMSNVTLKAAEGAAVTINGLVAFGGQVNNTKWYSRDFVADREMPEAPAYDNNISYWIGQKWSNITFEGLTFTGGVDIEAYGNKDTLIDNVKFDNCKFNIANNADATYCIRLNVDGNIAKANNLVVTKCDFANGLTAVLTDGMPNVTVTGSTFSGLKGHAISPMMNYLPSAPGYGNITVTGNTFTNMTPAKGDRVILRMGDVGVGAVFTIQNNTATGCDGLGNSIKVNSLTDGITYNISGNNWGSLTASHTNLDDNSNG